MMRAMPTILALIALFVFPWQVSFVAVFAAALFMPAAGIALGIIADIVYYVPGASFVPYFTLLGAVATAVSMLVHRFVKTRIIEG
ncbi:MAG TPA: hypothetical protein VNU25_03140 [Candidatus Paceibacterota bacterium]|nr:hypothetical protein [Candidatus Paceibacterota bacterium]